MLKVCSPQLGMSERSSLGGEIYDYQNIKGLTKKGVKVFVYLPKGRYFDKSLKNLKVEFCFVKHIFPPIIYSFLALPYVIATYRKEKFQILRIHSPRFLGGLGLIFNLLYPEVPILTSAVTVDSSKIYYWIEKKIYEKSAAIIVQSEYMKKFLKKKYKLSGNKIYVTYGGIIDRKVRNMGAKKGKKRKTLVFMGVLIDRKNPLFLLDVFKEISLKFDDIDLVFIGDGPLKKNLLQKVKEYDLSERVIFVDKAYGKEKEKWFSEMNIFALPSKDEGFGLVVTEAMSFGKPVLTSDKAAFPEIITNGIDGYTLPLNKKTWVKTACELLEDNEKSKKIGNSALKKVNSMFSWNHMYDLNYKVLGKII